jgi:MFS family permease
MSTCSPEESADQAENGSQQLVHADADPSARLWSKCYCHLLVIQFLFGLGYSTFYLLPKYLQRVYGANAASIGKVTGLSLLAAVVSTPLAATWVSRGKRRMPAVAALSLLAASALAFTFVDRIGLLMAGVRVAQGTAFSLFMTVIVTKTAEIAPKERLGQAIGYLGLAALVTNALSPVIAEPLADRLGWSAVFLLASGWCSLAAVCAWRIKDRSQPLVSRALRWDLLLRAPLRSILYAAMICGVALGVMFTYTQPLALQRGAHLVGGFFSGYAIFAASVRLFMGGLADRFGRRRMSQMATLGYALVVALSAGVTPYTLFWCGAGLGVAHGVLYPALNALAFEISAAKERGIVAAAFSGSFSLGYALSVLSLGYVADAWGLPSIFVGAALVTTTGAWALATVRPETTLDLPPLR